eukprot:gene26527-42914_t
MRKLRQKRKHAEMMMMTTDSGMRRVYLSRLREYARWKKEEARRANRSGLLCRNTHRGLQLVYYRKLCAFRAACRRRRQQKTYAQAMLMNSDNGARKVYLLKLRDFAKQSSLLMGCENGMRRVFFLRLRRYGVEVAERRRQRTLRGDLLLSNTERGMQFLCWRKLVSFTHMRHQKTDSAGLRKQNTKDAVHRSSCSDRCTLFKDELAARAAELERLRQEGEKTEGRLKAAQLRIEALMQQAPALRSGSPTRQSHDEALSAMREGRDGNDARASKAEKRSRELEQQIAKLNEKMEGVAWALGGWPTAQRHSPPPSCHLPCGGNGSVTRASYADPWTQTTVTCSYVDGVSVGVGGRSPQPPASRTGAPPLWRGSGPARHAAALVVPGRAARAPRRPTAAVRGARGQKGGGRRRPPPLWGEIARFARHVPEAELRLLRGGDAA